MHAAGYWRSTLRSTALTRVPVRIRDPGRGLDPQQRKRVFEPFFTTKPDGLGMGLTVSRTIVEAHGGRLWASANDEFGETFQFTLPVAEALPGESTRLGTVGTQRTTRSRTS